MRSQKKYDEKMLYEAFRAAMLEGNTGLCGSSCCDVIIIKAFEDWLKSQ